MIQLYDILQKKRLPIITALQRRIPKKVRAYSRVSRLELRESIERHYDAFLDYLITGDDQKLKRLFSYVARVRDTQGFSMSIVLSAFLHFLPTLREVLEGLEDEDDARVATTDFVQIEERFISAAAVFVDCYTEYLQSKVDQYNAYLDEQEKCLGVDLSKLILFRG